MNIFSIFLIHFTNKCKGWIRMFICNVKVNGNKLGKWFLGILFVIALIATVIICYRILRK